MHFNPKFILLSFVLPSVVLHSCGAATISTDDTVLAHIQSVPDALLSNPLREKLLHFRDAFVQWKKQHSKVYDFVEMVVKKMLTWVENHGTSEFVVAILLSLFLSHGCLSLSFDSVVHVYVRVFDMLCVFVSLISIFISFLVLLGTTVYLPYTIN
jgi:hypothetical protein